MANPVTCRTLANRIHRCPKYKERNSYLKSVGLVFNRILKKYKDNDKTFIEVFEDEFNNRSYTGPRKIYKHHKEEFKTYALKCAINMSIIFSDYNITNIMDNYLYKYKVKGHIGGRIKDKNIHFSYKNAKDTEKDLAYYTLNNYLYNQVKEIDNDCLVMSVGTGSFFLVEYNIDDYTIKKGFLKTIISNESKVRGEHCITCKNTCCPMFINGIDRLKIKL